MAQPVLTRRGYTLALTREPSEVREAQRLRHDVFVTELGAALSSPLAGVDLDAWDAYCDHLLVRDGGSGAVVGTYRLLPPERAWAVGGRYADSEFDLTPLGPIGGQLIEAGRSCVHPEHRRGPVISLMWTGIARYLYLTGHRYLAGCASVPLADGGGNARAVWELARTHHLAPAAHQVTPRRPWLVAEPPAAAEPAEAAVPPLLRGYLRLGAWVCGPPAYDPQFDVADLFVLLDTTRVDPRYMRFFLGQT